jgi:signal transduction histidine kinase
MIVNDFLDISRIEQGRMKYELSVFDLREVARQVLTELKPNIENAGLTCSCNTEHTDPVMVYADVGKVRQVIGNLVDNSIKYTPSGSITIEVSEANNMARLKISDTGIGISAEDIAKLFNKFTRARDANKTNVVGTGLGLYIAKQMIEAQNGRVWIESEGVGKGSSSIIELPLNKN